MVTPSSAREPPAFSRQWYDAGNALRRSRTAEENRRPLWADVRFARLDHRLWMAARRAQRRQGRGPGVGFVMGARGLHAVAPRADVRGARRDVPRRWRV